MSASYCGPCVADWGPKCIRVYTAGDGPRLVATIRAADLGSVDDLLRAYGWRRIGAWVRSDDTPSGHKFVPVERVDSADVDTLDPDGERRSG